MGTLGYQTETQCSIEFSAYPYSCETTICAAAYVQVVNTVVYL